jgi:hypothetical protein
VILHLRPCRRLLFLVLVAWVALARSAGAQVVGCHGGRLTDPQAYVMALVAGTNPAQYREVLQRIDAQLVQVGIWQQRTSGGEIRGRVFLPYAAAGYAPRDPFYDHAVDIVSSAAWVWVDRGGPAYAPYPCGTPPPPPPPPPPPIDPDTTGWDALLARVTKAEADLYTLTQTVGAFMFATDGRMNLLEAKPIPVGCAAAANLGAFKIPVSCALVK